MTAKNRLFYGDNLDVLRRCIQEESVDLVYLDPPFNSNADYHVLFAEKAGTKAAAQIIKAFEDTWQWDEAAAAAFHEVVESGGDVAQALIAFRTFLGESDMLAYLAMMAPRLVALRRVLKPTGSIYLHCDPTASHYLKMLMDAVFGPAQFKNEIIWKRTAGRSDSHRWNHIHDVVLFYGKSENITWNPQFTKYDDAYVGTFYRQRDASGRRFMSDNLTAAGTRGGTSGKPWKGIDPTNKGRHWAVPGAALEGLSVDDGASVQDTLDALEAANRSVWPEKEGGTPRFRRYLDEMPGVAIQSIITDIPPVQAHAAERVGYPTQKPLALLERIVKASSNEGDVVLDPFCGCGTTVDAAQKLERRWIGIDVTQLAIDLIKKRLSDAYGERIKDTYDVIGEPTSIDDAKNPLTPRVLG
jgi:DNA modification methylase